MNWIDKLKRQIQQWSRRNRDDILPPSMPPIVVADWVPDKWIVSYDPINNAVVLYDGKDVQIYKL